MDINLLKEAYHFNSTPIGILLAILIGLAAHYVAEKIFEQIFTVVKRKDPSSYTRRDLRAQTLLRVTNNFVSSLIIIIVIGVILTVLDVNLGAIFAVSSIIGVAVGFGSQSFVKDVINGIFFLYQDQIGEGDFVTTLGITGQIDDVSIRTVTIRDLQGGLTVIENGNISQITNYSKHHYTLFIDSTVSSSLNADDVYAAIQRAIDDFKSSKKSKYVKDIKILGIQDISGGKMVIRTRILTIYKHQYVAGRAFRYFLKKSFEESKIEFS